jgi:hypothetical protein
VRQSVTTVTAASTTPVTVDELRSWARIDSSEADATLTLLIATATELAELYLNRSLINRTLKLTLDMPNSTIDHGLSDGVYDLPVTALYGNFPEVIDLPKGPVSSITSVKTYDTSDAESTYSSGNYTLDTTGSRLLLTDDAVWPTNLRDRASIAINYVAGYGSAASSVPSAIRTGILIHASTLYEQRGQCTEDMPAPCRKLYAPFRVYGGRVA